MAVSNADARAPRADAARNRDMLLAAATRAFASADEEPSTSAEDVSAGLLGILAVASKRGNQAQASRLLDLLMDGLRPPAA
jgi:hypothetical protein